MSAPRVINNQGHKALVILRCLPRPGADGGECAWRIKRGACGSDQAGIFWGWDGNADQPTITPSIACDACKLHVSVIGGKAQ